MKRIVVNCNLALFLIDTTTGQSIYNYVAMSTMLVSLLTIDVNVLASDWVKMGWLMLVEVSVALACVIVGVVVVAHCSLPFLVVYGSIIPYWCRYVKVILTFFVHRYKVFS